MPRGGATSLTPVYAGLQADLDAFLRAFLKLESCSFVRYKDLFKHIGIIRLFNGRSNSAEIIEFNEHLLVYCQQYIHEYHSFGVKRTLEERLFGLYSMYTFFYLQQINHVAKIKMDVYSISSFNALSKLVCDEEIVDAMLCCRKLKRDKTIRGVAYSSAYDPTHFKRYRTEVNLNGLPLVANANNPLGTLKDMLKSPMFVGLGVAHKEYTRLKMTTKVDFGACFGNPLKAARDALRRTAWEADLQITNPIIPKELVSKKQLVSRSLIKDKAYTSKVKQARHRMPDAYQCSESFDYLKAEEKIEEVHRENVAIACKNKLPVQKVNNPTPQFEKPTPNSDNFDMKIEDPDDNKDNDESLQMVKEQTKQTRKRGRPRKNINPPAPSDFVASECVTKKKKSVLPAPLMPSGRRTNNSIASELFSLENPPADRIIKEELDMKQEIEEEIVDGETDNGVSAVGAVEVKLETEMKMEIDDDYEEVTCINPSTGLSSTSSTLLLKSNIKHTFGMSSKSVSFKERNGELVVMVRDITPLPASIVDYESQCLKVVKTKRASDIIEPEIPEPDEPELTIMEEISCEVFAPLPGGEYKEDSYDLGSDFGEENDDTENNMP